MIGPDRLHVAIDARMARDGGIGTYIRGVLPEIVSRRPDWRFSLLTRDDSPASRAWLQGANVDFVRCAAPIYSIQEQWSVRAAIPKDVDLFWSPHYNIPLLSTHPLVVTVHDVIHLARPEYRRNLARRAYARIMFGAVRRRARGILFNSHFTSAEFTRYVGKPIGMSAVTHLGVDDAWRRSAESIGDEQLETAVGRAAVARRPYVVCIGYRKPHKNLVGLVRAFQLLASSIPHDLVIVGRDEGLRTGDDEVVVAARPLGDRVRFTGEVAAAELRRWVAGAALLVQPSFYEGFGLPPLEAMAAGCPCVVARAGSLPEVCGEAAVYCDPLEPASIAAAIAQVLGDVSLQQTLIARGRRNADNFRWSQCAEQTLPILYAAARLDR